MRPTNHMNPEVFLNLLDPDAERERSSSSLQARLNRMCSQRKRMNNQSTRRDRGSHEKRHTD